MSQIANALRKKPRKPRISTGYGEQGLPTGEHGKRSADYRNEQWQDRKRKRKAQDRRKWRRLMHKDNEKHWV